jgi:hypothetical protein
MIFVSLCALSFPKLLPMAWLGAYISGSAGAPHAAENKPMESVLCCTVLRGLNAVVSTREHDRAIQCL